MPYFDDPGHLAEWEQELAWLRAERDERMRASVKENPEETATDEQPEETDAMLELSDEEFLSEMRKRQEEGKQNREPE